MHCIKSPPQILLINCLFLHKYLGQSCLFEFVSYFRYFIPYSRLLSLLHPIFRITFVTSSHIQDYFRYFIPYSRLLSGVARYTFPFISELFYITVKVRKPVIQRDKIPVLDFLIFQERN